MLLINSVKTSPCKSLKSVHMYDLTFYLCQYEDLNRLRNYETGLPMTLRTETTLINHMTQLETTH